MESLDKERERNHRKQGGGLSSEAFLRVQALTPEAIWSPLSHQFLNHYEVNSAVSSSFVPSQMEVWTSYTIGGTPVKSIGVWLLFPKLIKNSKKVLMIQRGLINKPIAQEGPELDKGSLTHSAMLSQYPQGNRGFWDFSQGCTVSKHRLLQVRYLMPCYRTLGILKSSVQPSGAQGVQAGASDPASCFQLQLPVIKCVRRWDTLHTAVGMYPHMNPQSLWVGN